MKHHLITLAFGVAAIVCYLLGLRSGFIVFAACGLILEGVIWMRVRRGRQRETSP